MVHVGRFLSTGHGRKDIHIAHMETTLWLFLDFIVKKLAFVAKLAVD